MLEFEEYKQMKIGDDTPEYYTRKGEHVRSKSEVIIANMLKDYGIGVAEGIAIKISSTLYNSFFNLLI